VCKLLVFDEAISKRTMIAVVTVHIVCGAATAVAYSVTLPALLLDDWYCEYSPV